MEVHRHDAHAGRGAPSLVRLDGDEVHRSEIVAELLVSVDAFVVGEEVAAAVHDRLARVHLERPRVMRRMPVHHVDPAVDERVREADVLLGDLVAPVPSPVDRDDDDVARAPDPRCAIDDGGGLVVAEIAEERDAGCILARRPPRRDAARRMTDAEHEHAPASG